VLGALWNRLTGRRNADATERKLEPQQMSPAERRFVEESFEDRQTDSAIEERLGGIDPARLLDDEEPPRD
jgi:hypothetical protein